jgi:diacylglycerol kinase (ATP)
MIRSEALDRTELTSPPRDGPAAPRPASDGDLADPLAEWGETPAWAPRAGRRTFREKFAAGVSGLKHAVRGDSSFFAHAYRGLLIALTAALLGVGPMAWCLLVLATGLVLIAELTHSAVDSLARALGDPNEPRLKVAREIATAGVLIAVTLFAAVSITVLMVKLGELLGWWA